MYEKYPSRPAAAEAAADLLEASLRRRLGEEDDATLVLSGGSTPGPTMAALAARTLPFDRVHVLPSDERWVPADHADSNARLIRETFLSGGNAQDASLVSFYAEDREPRAQAALLGERLKALPFPFAAALLGMGEDGHFASLFPDAPNLEDALDVDGDDLVVAVTTAASEHARISLTLAALSRSDEIVLLIFGEEKRAVIDEASRTTDRYPVSALLRQKRAPLRILWAA